MRNPDLTRWTCGCPRLAGQRQCLPCKKQWRLDRKAGRTPRQIKPRVGANFTCGHPYIPVNIIRNGRGPAHKKGRCRFCRTGVLSFDLTTGEPLPGATLPSLQLQVRTPLAQALVTEAKRLLAKPMAQRDVAVAVGISKSSVARIARRLKAPPPRPRPAPRLKIVPQPLPKPRFEYEPPARSYAQFPLKTRRSA